MFNKKIISLLILIPVFVFTGCEDYSSVEVESQSNEQVDFSSYVAVGNSLTAGLQSNALYETAQEYSFPNLLARQFHVIDDFEQPIISEPGIGERIQLDDNLEPTSTGDGSGTNLNANLERPYNNLGIPGAILADFTGTDLPGLPYSDRQDNNPFFDVILRDFGNTQAEQMAAQEPTFVTFWQGNNDVLGYVTSGGHTAYTPSGPQGFAGLYQASVDAIAATGAEAVVYNIPDVTSIPFVFIVNQTLLQDGTITVNNNGNYALITPQGPVPLWIQRTDPSDPGAIQDTVRMSAPNPSMGNPGSFFLLSARSELPGLLAQGVGLSEDNPIPSPLVLDDGETAQALSLINDYNNTIDALAAGNGFPVVNVNEIFNQIIANGGISSDGVDLAPIPGSLFSFDGVHPTNRGHGIITNATIEVINNAYGTNLSLVDISEIPLGFPVAAN